MVTGAVFKAALYSSYLVKGYGYYCLLMFNIALTFIHTVTCHIKLYIGPKGLYPFVLP